MFVRSILTCLIGVAAVPAVAAPVAVGLGTALPPIQPGGLTVDLQRFATLPKTGGTGRRIQFLSAAPVAGSSDLFAVDEAGRIDRVSADGRTVTPYLDVAALAPGFSANGGEKGLVGLAFHPNFAGDAAKPGYGVFYTAYSRDTKTAAFLQSGANDHTQVIGEWHTADPKAASFGGTSREVLSVGHFASNHNGGVIAFNPAAAPGSADYGNLYIGFGDGGGGNDPADNGQNITSPLGKILRINPLASGAQPYTVPADNPFLGNTGGAGAAPLVYAYGLRNPQQFSFDKSGRLFIDDIGQGSVEEVNLGAKGANYGWQSREGRFATGSAVGVGKDGKIYPIPAGDAGFTDPIAEYAHAAFGPGSYAIGSGFLYEGKELPQLDGKYVFTDFAQNRLFWIDPALGGPGADAPIHELTLSLDGVDYASLNDSPLAAEGRPDLRLGEGPDGELYALVKGVGDILRVTPGAGFVTVSEPGSIAAVGVAALALVRRASRRPRRQTAPARR